MTKEDIKEQILALAKDYAKCLAEENAKKEKKYIPASGKNVGYEELSNMIEASLDMWLTAGRFNDEFEKSFAEKLGVKYALSTNSGSSANLLALTALTSYKLKDRALKKEMRSSPWQQVFLQQLIRLFKMAWFRCLLIAKLEHIILT